MTRIGEKRVVQEATYIVHPEGDWFYADPSKETSKRAFSGSDPSAVLALAIAELTSGRTRPETIILKGEMNIHDVELANYLNLIGRDCELTLPDGYDYLFKQTDADLTRVSVEDIDFISETAASGRCLEFFYFTDPTWRTASYIKVKGCTFTDFLYATHGILTSSRILDNLYIDNNISIYFDAGSGCLVGSNIIIVPLINYARAMQITDTGVLDVIKNSFIGQSSTGNGIGVASRTSGRINLNDNLFNNLGQGGIILDYVTGAASNDWSIKDNIFNNMALKSGACIWLGYQYANLRIEIIDNHFYDFGVGVRVSSTGVDMAVDADIEHNTFYTATGSRYPYLLYGTTFDIRMKNNRFLTPTAGVIEAGTLVAKDNVGYVTENNGIAEGTGAQQTIAHGLDVTPDRIQLSSLEDGALPFQSAAADTTNIYIQAVSGKDFLWVVWKA